MVSLNHNPVRRIEIDGSEVASYTSEDLPAVREGLMKVMRANKNDELGRIYQRILLGTYEPEVGNVVDGLAEDLGL